MARYNHKFKDGDVVHDTQHNETFVFSDSADGFAAENNPDRFRIATEAEKQAIQDDPLVYKVTDGEVSAITLTKHAHVPFVVTQVTQEQLDAMNNIGSKYAKQPESNDTNE
mgnify:CR=1 FL=1